MMGVRIMLKRSWVILLVLTVVVLSCPIAVQADGSVCEMDGVQYDTLSEALALVGSDESKTILILQNIEHNNGMAIDNRHVTFALNGFTVNIINTAATSPGLSVTGGGSVSMTGTGSLNVEAVYRGVFVSDSGQATVTTATSQQQEACFAVSGGTITVKGNAVCMGNGSICLRGHSNSTINVDGDVLSKGSGAGAFRSVDIAIGGHVVAENGYGAYSDEFSSIIIRGNISATSFGVHAVYDSSTVQVDGVISAPTPIEVGHVARTLEDYDEVGTGEFSDYLIYIQGSNRVYVRNHPEVIPVSASFDQNGGMDIVLETKPYSASLLNIYNGEAMLAAGTDYTILNNTITLSAEYFNEIPLGSYELTLDFSNGVDPVFSLSVVDSTPVTEPTTTETSETTTTGSTSSETTESGTTAELTHAESSEPHLSESDPEASEIPKTGEEGDKMTLVIIIVLLLAVAAGGFILQKMIGHTAS